MSQVTGSSILFFVSGIPVAKGSLSGFPFTRKDGRIGVRMIDKTKGVKNWAETVAQAGREAMWKSGRKMFPADVPVTLSTQFYVERPPSVAKDRVFPTVKPDLGKLERAIEDALTGIVYEDDKQIVTRPNSQKRYREPDREGHPRSPGVIITVTRQI